jgi:hypothetical protein
VRGGQEELLIADSRLLIESLTQAVESQSAIKNQNFHLQNRRRSGPQPSFFGYTLD